MSGSGSRNKLNVSISCPQSPSQGRGLSKDITGTAPPLRQRPALEFARYGTTNGTDWRDGYLDPAAARPGGSIGARRANKL